MSNIDTKNKFTKHPFSYKITKSDIVIIYRDNIQVMIIKGKAAVKLQSKLCNKSDKQTQLVLAKITGNYKRGNERTN